MNHNTIKDFFTIALNVCVTDVRSNFHIGYPIKELGKIYGTPCSHKKSMNATSHHFIAMA